MLTDTNHTPSGREAAQNNMRAACVRPCVAVKSSDLGGRLASDRRYLLPDGPLSIKKTHISRDELVSFVFI
jgi:hypothetical protein